MGEPMSERLHDLLHEAVPDDAPTLDPHVVVGAARRARRRARVLTGGVVALVLVAGGAVATVVDGDRDDHVADRLGPDPYGAPQCPAVVPEPGGTPAGLDLDGAVSVRLCPDLSALGDEELAERIRSGMDALVTGLDDFGDQLAALDGDGVRCGPDTPADERRALQVAYADGSTALVPMDSCVPVRVAQREVDPRDVVETYLLALRTQRTTRPARPPRLPEPSCETSRRVPNPAGPGHGHLVAAVQCGPNGGGTALDDDQLAALDEAWRRPGRPGAEDDCSTSPLYLGAVTDQGDLVFLEESSCGHLAWRGDVGEPATVPTTLQRLGVKV